MNTQEGLWGTLASLARLAVVVVVLQEVCSFVCAQASVRVILAASGWFLSTPGKFWRKCFQIRF